LPSAFSELVHHAPRFSIAARVGGGNALPDRDVNYFTNGHAPPVVVVISLCEKYAERTKPPMKRRWAVSGAI
jgi:hypothetical protein